jgi:allantoin racemase
MLIYAVSPLPLREVDGWHIKRLVGHARPGVEIRVRAPRHGLAAIESWWANALSVPATVDQVCQAEAEGAAAIVIYCTADTGLYEARERVSIPVVGLTESAMHVAAMLAHSFSVLTFLDSTSTRFELYARRYNVAHALRSVRSIEVPVTHLHLDTQDTLDRLVAAAVLAVQQDGAHALVLGCGAFPDAVRAISERLHEVGFDVPVIEPSAVAIKLAESLVDVRLSQSKRTYPMPAPAQLVGPAERRVPGIVLRNSIE